MKKKLKRVGTGLALCATASMILDATNSSCASTHYKTRSEYEILRVWSIIGDESNPFVIGASISSVDVFSRVTEYYSTSGSNVTYSSRRTYATFKDITSAHRLHYTVVPIKHGTTAFNDWKKEDFLAGDVDYCYSRTSATKKTYKKSNSQVAKWSVGIYTDEMCDFPVCGSSHEMSLNINSGSGK